MNYKDKKLIIRISEKQWGKKIMWFIVQPLKWQNILLRFVVVAGIKPRVLYHWDTFPVPFTFWDRGLVSVPGWPGICSPPTSASIVARKMAHTIVPAWPYIQFFKYFLSSLFDRLWTQEFKCIYMVEPQSLGMNQSPTTCYVTLPKLLTYLNNSVSLFVKWTDTQGCFDD